MLLQYILWVLPRSVLVRETKYSLLGRDYTTKDFVSIIKKKEVNILRYIEKKGTAKQSGLSRIYGEKEEDKKSIAKNHRGDKELRIMEA